jgi:two-component system response regulator (stage 0 sporulation protein F)
MFKRVPNDSLTKAAPDKLIRKHVPVAGTDIAVFRWSMDAPLRILAVDNEPSVTLSLSYVFADPRYEVTCVEDGDAALARLEADSDPYDVIIVDQKMPNLTGVELVDAIRKRRILSKIIVLSAHLSPEIRKAYEQMDVHVMFGKPFNVDHLRTAVDRLTA